MSICYNGMYMAYEYSNDWIMHWHMITRLQDMKKRSDVAYVIFRNGEDSENSDK